MLWPVQKHPVGYSGLTSISTSTIAAIVSVMYRSICCIQDCFARGCESVRESIAIRQRTHRLMSDVKRPNCEGMEPATAVCSNCLTSNERCQQQRLEAINSQGRQCRQNTNLRWQSPIQRTFPQTPARGNRCEHTDRGCRLVAHNSTTLP